MTRIVSLCFISLFLFTSSALAAVDHVVVISIDGGKPASIFKSNMPNLKAITKEGASTFLAETIMPSKTLPAHTSMVTGVLPAVHKITWNSWNPFKGTLKIPTMFSLAKEQGLSTALFATKSKFKHLNKSDSLDVFSLNSSDAKSIAKESTKYLASKKPRLLFIHMPDADTAGHAYGWESPEQLKALENVDAAIGFVKQTMEQVLQGKFYVLIVTADHGGSAKDHGSDSDDDRIIPWITWGSDVKSNHTISSAVNTMDTAATVLWLLGIAPPTTWSGVPVEDAYN